ncbi:MAG TPA: DUF962 domain-containing protein [bacterium]|nr:DUF962 domain-containing protein [bacterium]
MDAISEKPKESFLEVYRTKHTHPVNKVLHTIGIPAIVVSLVVVFFNWKIGLALFVGGWALQFVGHIFEGTPPAFFKNPIYLIVGPIWWVKKLLSRDRSKTSATSP